MSLQEGCYFKNKEYYTEEGVNAFGKNREVKCFLTQAVVYI